MIRVKLGIIPSVVWTSTLVFIFQSAASRVLAEQTVSSTNNVTFKNVEMDSTHVVVLKGSGFTTITVKPQSKSSEQIVQQCNSIDQVWCVLPKINATGEDTNTFADVEVSCHQNTTCELGAELKTEAYLQFEKPAFRSYLRMSFPEELTELEFEAKTNRLFPLGANLDTYKLKFNVGGGDRTRYLPGFFSANNLLKLEVKVLKKDQPRSSAKKIRRETTEVGSHVLATVFGGDDDFCASDECSYLIKITSKTNTYLDFAMDPIEKVQRVDIGNWGLSNSYWLEDQVFSTRPSIYKFVLEQAGDMTFELMPSEGNPDIFVNIGDPADFNPNRYQYKSESDSLESILISNKEIEAKGEKGKEVFVIIQSKETSSYYLSGTWKSANNSDEAMPIKLNTFYSGLLHDREITNFILTFNPSVPEVVSGYATLKAAAGNPDLYLKDCEQEENCQITLDEIKRMKELQKHFNESDYEGYFIYSENEVTNDNLYFELMVSPSSYKNSLPEENVLDKPAQPKKKIFESRYNKICVAVVGNKNTFSNVSKYSLVVSGKNSHKVIKEYQTEYLWLNTNDEAYFVFKAMYLPNEAKGVILTFSAGSGDLNFYFSRFNRYPSEDNNDMQLIVDNDQRVSESTTRNLKIKAEDLRSDGVYFGFVAKKESLVKLMVSYWLPEGKEGAKYIELIPNAPVIRHLNQVSDFMDSSRRLDIFVFSINQGNHDVFVKLRTLYGEIAEKENFCAVEIPSYSGVPYKYECTKFGVNGLLSIKQNDNKSTKWAIFVKPAEKNGHHSLEEGISYEITLLAQGSIRTISALGHPVEDVLAAGEEGSNLHLVDFVSEKKSVSYYLVVESLNKEPLYADISFDKENFNWNSYNMYVSGDGKVVQSKEFTAADIRKFCSPMTMEEAADHKNRILQTSQVDENPESGYGKPGLHGEYGMPLLCRGFIRVAKTYLNSDVANPYRIIFASSDDTIVIDQSKNYHLPTPLSKPLNIKSYVGSLPNGAAVTIHGLYEQFQAAAVVSSQNPKDVDDVQKGSMILSSGYASTTLELTRESFEEILNKDSKNRDNFIEVHVTVDHEGEDEKHNKTTIVPNEFFSISISTLVTPIMIGRSVSGRVSQGKLRITRQLPLLYPRNEE